MNFAQIIGENKFSTVVSLPENNLSLAKAALDGGAHAIKVHCNVWHRASGHTFGTYEQNKTFLKELVELCNNVPVGLVPGGEDAFITAEERDEIEALGVSFFSSYAHHLPCYMMDSKKLSKMVAIDSTYTNSTLDAVSKSNIDVLECSIQAGEFYGTALNYADILKYGDIVQKSKKPCLVPTQRAIKSREIKYLHEAGCKAIMIGAIVMGKEPSADDVQRITSAYREATESL